MVDLDPKTRQAVLDDLNEKVTTAILKAERFSTKRREGQRAWSVVAGLEDRIALVTTPDSVEGYYARRGAVRAALVSGDKARARAFYFAYLREGISEKLKQELRQMLKEAK